jgi:hypothetical protein
LARRINLFPEATLDLGQITTQSAGSIAGLSHERPAACAKSPYDAVPDADALQGDFAHPKPAKPEPNRVIIDERVDGGGEAG